jgi:hypothetical protein
MHQYEDGIPLSFHVCRSIVIFRLFFVNENDALLHNELFTNKLLL